MKVRKWKGGSGGERAEVEGCRQKWKGGSGGERTEVSRRSWSWMRATHVLVFRGDLIHVGAEHRSLNIRIHSYIDSPCAPEVRDGGATYHVLQDSWPRSCCQKCESGRRRSGRGRVFAANLDVICAEIETIRTRKRHCGQNVGFRYAMISGVWPCRNSTQYNSLPLSRTCFYLPLQVGHLWPT